MSTSLKQFVLDEQGLNDLLNRAYRLGMSKGVRLCEPDLWKNDERLKELERATKDWLGYDHERRDEWLVGDVFGNSSVPPLWSSG